MKKMPAILILMAAILAVPAACKTGPMISVDSEQVDLGIIKQGSRPSAKYSFKVKNTGDSVLVIRDVRPGWGCTVVGFDTTILPGREGSITPEVAIGKIHGGPFSKCVTVTSNAKNKPEMHLCIKATIKVPVAITPEYIQMRKVDGTYKADISLTTEKPDLKVNDLIFKSNPGSATQGQNAWQNDLPLHCQFTLTKPEKSNNEGAWDYKLLATYSGNETETKFGEFVITTNHPDAQEVKANGTIEKSPDRVK